MNKFERHSPAGKQILPETAAGDPSQKAVEVIDILLQRAFFARSRGEARQRQQLFAALIILIDAFLDHRAERIPDFRKGLGLLVAETFQLTDHASGHRAGGLLGVRRRTAEQQLGIARRLFSEIQRRASRSRGRQGVPDETAVGAR